MPILGGPAVRQGDNVMAEPDEEAEVPGQQEASADEISGSATGLTGADDDDVEADDYDEADDVELDELDDESDDEDDLDEADDELDDEATGI